MRSFRRWRPVVTGILLMFCFAAMPLLAAEGADQDPVETPVGAIFRWLNFALIFGAIVWVITKHGGSFFRGNAKAISASIHEATAEKAEADRELSEVNTKISRLDQEVTDLRASARNDGAAEAERLRASGQAEIVKIKQAAQAELEASGRAAQHELREIAAAMAVQRAGDVINSRMNPEIRAKLLQSFLTDLAGRTN